MKSVLTCFLSYPADFIHLHAYLDLHLPVRSALLVRFLCFQHMQPPRLVTRLT